MRKRLHPDWQVHIHKYRIYLRGGFRFAELPDTVRKEAHEMRTFWNRLVRAATDSSARYHAILAEVPALRALQEEEERVDASRQALVERIKQIRQNARSRKSPEEAALRDQLQAARDRLREVRAHLKEAKAEAREKQKPLLQQHQEQWEAYLREERRTTDFHFGNREFLLDTFKTALREARKEGVELQEKNGPFREIHFKQPYTSGLSFAQLWTHRGRVRLARTDNPHRVTGQFQAGQTTLDFDCHYHRPLPEDGRIKAFDLVGREVMRPSGRRNAAGQYQETKAVWEWHLLVIVEHPPAAPLPVAGSCGIDLGWRQRPDGSLRVAFLVAGDHREEICLPVGLIRDFARVIDLQQELQVASNTAAEVIRAWVLAEQVNFSPALVERLAKPNWSRLTLFAILRETTDERIRTALHDYAHDTIKTFQDQRRLYSYCQRYRNDWYRKKAWAITQSFGEIILEDLDLRELRKTEKREGSPGLILSEYLGRFANLSFFRQCVREAAQKTGRRVRKVPAPDTTRLCHVCHTLVEENNGALYLTCPNGHTWDQDENAGINLFLAPLVALPDKEGENADA